MTARARRRRALLMLSLALGCGGLAASEVSGRMREIERRVGAEVPVLVTTRDVPAESRLRRKDLAVRQVPSRYVAPGSLSSPAQAARARTAVALPSGAPVTEAQLGGGAEQGPGPGGLRRGERAVEVAVSGAAALEGAAQPGARVDVLVSTEPRDGPGRSLLALQDVELLGLRPGDGTGAGPAGGRAGEQGAAVSAGTVATLRVTMRQAVYLTAAQNFAREVRLLSRPAGDSGRAGRTVVGAGGL